MARGNSNRSLPRKLHYLQTDHGAFFGPYMKRPTALLNDKGGRIITWEMDTNGNYIKQ